MNAIPKPIPARHRNVNRAEVCDQDFVEFVEGWSGTPRRAPRADEPVVDGSLCTANSNSLSVGTQLNAIKRRSKAACAN